MAENDDDKTEYLSQKKLEQSRERGELPRSQELNTFAVFALFLLFFGMNRMKWFDSFGQLVADLLRFNSHMNITPENLGEFLLAVSFKAALIVGPLLGLILIVSPLVSMCQTGFNIATEKLTPDWSRLDPISGFQKFFSKNQWIEGGKSCLKIGLFGWLAWTALRARLDDIQKMGSFDLPAQIGILMDVSISIGIRITVTLAVLSIFDFGYQWWQFNKRMRMTQQEMKDEMKERDGNPLIKQRQRSVAMQAARNRMMQAVPKANVVVTNPTHFAVALTYDKDKAPAPYVSAKGRQFTAMKIKELAKKHGIPIIENKPLARALYKHVKIGQVIPSEFYKAIAEVLAFVYMLKRRRGTASGTHVMKKDVMGAGQQSRYH